MLSDLAVDVCCHRWVDLKGAGCGWQAGGGPSEVPIGSEGAFEHRCQNSTNKYSMTDAGIKLGVFADAGTRTCGGAAASYNFEHVDAQSFADWGLSYLKYDNCNAPDVDPCAPLCISCMHA